jgi:hypothetical protein
MIRRAWLKAVLTLTVGLVVAGGAGAAQALTRDQCYRNYQTTANFCGRLRTNYEKQRCYANAAEVLAECTKYAEDSSGSCRVSGLFCGGGGGGGIGVF